MHVFSIVRLVAFGVVLAFSLIVLGIAANFVAQSSGYSGYTGYGFGSTAPGFSVATPVLTFVILIPVIIIDFLRKGAMTSLAAVELGFTGFLWVLWLACASNSTAALGGASLGDCGYTYLGFSLGSAPEAYCHQYQALLAFSWLNWLILVFYWIALLSFAILAQSRGNKNAFMQPTAELAVSVPYGGNATGEPKVPPVQGYPTGNTYPPQGQYPQQSFAPGQYPQQSYTPSQFPQQTYTPAPLPPPVSTVSTPPPPPPGAAQV
jgi:hypothetical protein